MLRKAIQLTVAALLFAGSAYGTSFAFKAARASAAYHEAKFGAAKHDLARRLALCEQSYQLYPHNYYLCSFAGKSAFYDVPDAATPAERAAYAATAARWRDRGLRENTYDSELRELHLRILEGTSLPDAIRYWQTVVEWQFWDPYNHAVLVDLYCKAGDIERAFESMPWVQGSQHFEEAGRRIQDAWRKQKEADRLMKPAPPKR